MVLQMTVCWVGLSWGPNDVEVFHSVFQPPALPIASLAALLFHSPLDKTLGRDIVSLDASGWLRMLEC